MAMKILLVDDDPNICDLFAMEFDMAGHQTYLVHNGLAAVAAVQNAAAQQMVFDVIVMDVEMPHMDGLEAIRQIRELAYGEEVPILVFTGYVGKDYYHQACKAGADDIVYKPLYASEMLERLTTLYKRRSR